MDPVSDRWLGGCGRLSHPLSRCRALFCLSHCYRSALSRTHASSQGDLPAQGTAFLARPGRTYMGPEIPPSFLILQKWTIIRRLARMGRKMQ